MHAFDRSSSFLFTFLLYSYCAVIFCVTPLIDVNIMDDSCNKISCFGNYTSVCPT
jgi:hypothetical protein